MQSKRVGVSGCALAGAEYNYTRHMTGEGAPRKSATDNVLGCAYWLVGIVLTLGAAGLGLRELLIWLGVAP